MFSRFVLRIFSISSGLISSSVNPGRYLLAVFTFSLLGDHYEISTFLSRDWAFLIISIILSTIETGSFEDFFHEGMGELKDLLCMCFGFPPSFGLNKPSENFCHRSF